MPGCPSCGSDRLKGVPLPIVSPVVELLSSRRRYRCSDCGWSGWKHRLRRIGRPTSLVDSKGPPARAIWFFVVIVGLLLIASALLLRSCAPWERPPAQGAIDARTDLQIARAAR